MGEGKMEMKHTKGPWVLDETEGRIVASDPRQTIVVGGFGGSIANPDVMADARLISAAPELLDALLAAREAIANFPRSLAYDITHLPKIDAAISKATGAKT